MSRIIHYPAKADPSKPYCGRVLSRNPSLTTRGYFTMLTRQSETAPGFANGQSAVEEKPCRHCQRALGFLPPLRSTRGFNSDETLDEDMEELEGDEE